MKFIIGFVFSASILFAIESYTIKAEIIKNIFSGLIVEEEIVIWSDNKHILNSIKRNDTHKTSEECIDANFIVLEVSSDIQLECLDKKIFVLSYEMLNDLPQSFGALFWKKGRVNIILLEPRLKERSIEVSKELVPYMEEKVW